MDVTSRNNLKSTNRGRELERADWHTGAQQPQLKRLNATPPLTETGRCSGEQEQGGLWRQWLGPGKGALYSVLQYGLIALEHTLGNLRSSAFQRDLREQKDRKSIRGELWSINISKHTLLFHCCEKAFCFYKIMAITSKQLDLRGVKPLFSKAPEVLSVHLVPSN